MSNKLTIADFFCGGGGFSEGFRMAGFDVVFAVDNWGPARQTHKLNHPECLHPGLDCLYETEGDIMEIKLEDIPDTDVIIGSPPCVTFSSSNKAGKADKAPGVQLIKSYLRIVAIKKHQRNSVLKYWIMENVPNSMHYTEEKYTFEMLGIDVNTLKKFGIDKKPKDIALVIDKQDKLFNSVYFGVPQRRTRFICGEFPAPKQTTPEEPQQLTLGKVIISLSKKSGMINDPVYGFPFDVGNITDHFYDTTIPKQVWTDSKYKKRNARFYGKMSFPEDYGNSSRTVTATMTSSSRESMILNGSGKTQYRSPTIREVASLMSFPVNYLFQAPTDSAKYRLIGNAVCPKLAYEIASAISTERGIEPRKNFKSAGNKSLLSVNLRYNPPAPKTVKDRHPNANFAEIVPELKIDNFRVDLDNNSPRKGTRKLVWNATIHHATGIKNMKKSKTTSDTLRKIIMKSLDGKGHVGVQTTLTSKATAKNIDYKTLMSDLDKTVAHLLKKIPEGKLFQEQHCKLDKSEKFISPRDSLEKTKDIIDDYFPEKEYSNFSVPYPGLKFRPASPPRNRIPIRVLVAAYILTSVTEKANTKNETETR